MCNCIPCNCASVYTPPVISPYVPPEGWGSSGTISYTVDNHTELVNLLKELLEELDDLSHDVKKLKKDLKGLIKYGR